MALHWEPAALGSVCILPAAAVRTQLAIASHLQWKVLLWFSAAGGEFDAAACAAALHKPVEAVEEAVQYWIAAHILAADGTAVSTEPVPPTATPAAAPQEPQKPPPAARPLPVKPQMADVLRRQQESAEFSSLLHDVSARFGKPITQGNMETLLYLYDTAGISAQIILLVVAYAVSRGKINMRYVEKVALDWQDSGITTVAAAEEHLALLEQMDAAAARVRSLAGMSRELDYRQRGMAHTWLYVWGQSEALIKVALDYAAKTTKPVIPYANAILARWHEEGVTDPAAAAKTLERETPAARRRAQTEKSSLDLQSYEDMLADYVPTLPVKSEKE